MGLWLGPLGCIAWCILFSLITALADSSRSQGDHAGVYIGGDIGGVLKAVFYLILGCACLCGLPYLCIKYCPGTSSKFSVSAEEQAAELDTLIATEETYARDGLTGVIKDKWTATLFKASYHVRSHQA